ncbi:hypothetical protein JXB27_02745 [Candidatus Woesearchaeota archaeon]|nr:hypothetical protein [Candidatus Woesearchaeota archaeon]
MKLLYAILVLLVVCSFTVFAQEDAPQEELPQENMTEMPPEPVLVCSQNQCDDGCVKCSDRKCHEPGFECVEQVAIEKIFPKEIQIGQTQISLLIRNIGNVDLEDVFAEITGDGITSIERISIDSLPEGKDDYAFVKINAEKSGTIDVVIKTYIDGRARGKLVEQIEVAKSIPAEPEVNATILSQQIAELRTKYKSLETLYQQKKNEGFSVDIAYDNLRLASSYIIEAQGAVVEGSYKKVQADIAILQGLLEDVELQITSAQKQKESFGDMVKNNLLFFGSLAAAIISIITALTLIRTHLSNQKLLHRLGRKKFKELKRKQKLKREREDRRKDED